MKFTEEQVEKVSALREELAAKVSMYSSGRQHARELLGESRENTIFWTWIDGLSVDITALEIEEKKVLDTEIEDLDESEFYMLIGRYFQKLDEDVEKSEDIARPLFYSLINVYQKKITKALK